MTTSAAIAPAKGSRGQRSGIGIKHTGLLYSPSAHSSHSSINKARNGTRVGVDSDDGPPTAVAVLVCPVLSVAWVAASVHAHRTPFVVVVAKLHCLFSCPCFHPQTVTYVMPTVHIPIVELASLEEKSMYLSPFFCANLPLNPLLNLLPCNPCALPCCESCIGSVSSLLFLVPLHNPSTHPSSRSASAAQSCLQVCWASSSGLGGRVDGVPVPATPFEPEPSHIPRQP